MNLDISKRLMHSTIRVITFYDENKSKCATGTGFVFSFNIEGKICPVLLTNKHVIQEAKLIELVFTKSDDDGTTPDYGSKFSVTLTNPEARFIMHPVDNVDLCLIPLGPLLHEIKENHNVDIFTVAVNESEMIDPLELNEYSVLEDVLMIGYPNGLWDETNNLPIFRKGVTAVHPKFDYNGKKDVVIDMPCFPGSSGSPVFLYNEGTYRKGNSVLLGNRIKLLGVLYSGPTQSIDGEIIQEVTHTALSLKTRTQTMLNIGYAIKSERILDFKPILEKLINQR